MSADIPTGGGMILATLIVVDDHGRHLGTCRAHVGRVAAPEWRAGLWATNGYGWARITDTADGLTVPLSAKFRPMVRK